MSIATHMLIVLAGMLPLTVGPQPGRQPDLGGSEQRARAVAWNCGEKRTQSPAGALRAASPQLTLEEVKAIVDEEFKGIFRVGISGAVPDYVVGDITGDGVDDLFVLAKLTRNTDLTGSSDSSFKIDNPLGTAMEEGRLNQHTFSLKDLKDYMDETIQLIIHGSQAYGFRGDPAQQKFILLHPVDSGATRVSLFRGSFSPTRAGDEEEIVKPPALDGSAVLLLDEGSTGTALYWDGKRYRWYPVEKGTLRRRH